MSVVGPIACSDVIVFASLFVVLSFDCPSTQWLALAGDVRYVWPITQPVTDLDTQKKRMQRIRRELGWLLVGCELVECYDEDTDSSAGGNFFTRQLRLFSPQH